MMEKRSPIVLLIIGIVILIVTQWMDLRWDLTDDKRYSMSEPVQELVEEYDEIVLIESLFAGDFPVNYNRLQEAIEEMLQRMRRINPRINFRMINPLEGREEEVNNRMRQFSGMGLIPFPIRYESNREFNAVQAFPYVVFSVEKKTVVVNLLEGGIVGDQTEVGINNAISQLEYKFANALSKLKQESRKSIGFLTGHGEYDYSKTYFLERELRKYYMTSRVDLDSVKLVPDPVELLIIADPREDFIEEHLFAIDEYVARGGSIIWLFEKFRITDDSLNRPEGFTPVMNTTSLESLFFKYGIRFNSDIVADLESSNTPIVTSSPSGQPQIELFPWFYHILANPGSEHITTRNIPRVNMFYPSSIESLEVEGLSNDVLIRSSPRSRTQQYPFLLSFEILKYPVEESAFNNGNQVLAVIREGIFPSYFQNRMSQSHKETLINQGKKPALEPQSSKQVFISDAEFIATKFTQQENEPLPVGYNLGERTIYPGNEIFILNLVEYLVGDGDILSAKTKTRKLYLLDDTKANAEKTIWRAFNILFPLLLLAIFGIIFNYYRRRKYT